MSRVVVTKVKQSDQTLTLNVGCTPKKVLVVNPDIGESMGAGRSYFILLKLGCHWEYDVLTALSYALTFLFVQQEA